jgi:hypothetical protein
MLVCSNSRTIVLAEAASYRRVKKTSRQRQQCGS